MSFSEVLAVYSDILVHENVRYIARACGEQRDDGLWEGFLTFEPADGVSQPIRTERETTQPNRVDLAYWASGLTGVYLEGAFQRAVESARPAVIVR